MIIITNVYAPTHETEIMRQSFERHGYEVAAINTRGNGNVLRELLACFQRAATGHELFMYADGADTFMQRPLTKKEEESLTNRLVYCAESNCWPSDDIADQYPKASTKWKYLNGGIYAGPLSLAIEFFTRYGLNKHQPNANGQWEQANAFLKAQADGFPIELDTKCKLFQTTAFDPVNHVKDGKPPEDSAFTITRAGKVRNKITKTTPAVLHANGRSPMEWYWDLHDWTKKLRP